MISLDQFLDKSGNANGIKLGFLIQQSRFVQIIRTKIIILYKNQIISLDPTSGQIDQNQWY